MIFCPKCHSATVKDGWGHTDEQHYRCKGCGYWFPLQIFNAAKVFLFDIETSTALAHVWSGRMWDVKITPTQLEKDWFMLSWCGKWLNDCETMKYVVKPKEAKNRDDERIVKKLWQAFDHADIIIGHNCSKFDIPKSKDRFITLGLNPPSPFRIIDTVKVARSTGAFTFNNLDYLGRKFGVGRKEETHYQLWLDCVHGEKKALQTMVDYNEQDVLLLEEVYLKLRGWTKSHPNMNLWQEETGCSNCGSLKIHPKGHYVTQVNKYRSFVCDDCGGYSRTTKKSLASIAR